MALRFDTVEARYLVYVYVGVWLVQGGYFGRVAWQWFHTRKPRAIGEVSRPRR